MRHGVRRSWVLRAGSALAAVVVGVTAFAVSDLDIHPVRLALLILLTVATAWLVADGLVEPGPTWRVPLQPVQLVPPGSDRRLAVVVGVLESHRTSDVPDTTLRDRLADLTDRRLSQRLGMSRSHPTAREILGDELLAVLEGPARRLGAAELARHLHRIEEL